jgi:hypothetical protein
MLQGQISAIKKADQNAQTNNLYTKQDHQAPAEKADAMTVETSKDMNEVLDEV